MADRVCRPGQRRSGAPLQRYRAPNQVLDHESDAGNARSSGSSMMSQNLSFDDVLDDLMLEEETPSHEALVRWQKRYPQYRKQLADYFAAWAIQEAYAAGQQRTHIDEEKLVQRGVDYAMETLRKQGRLLPADYNPSVNPFDQQVLAAVYALHGQGYPVNIGEKVGEMSGSRPMLGTVLMSLNRLESK